MQVIATLKARLQKAEADLHLSHSKQQHMQLQLDSATAQSSTLADELESAMHSNAQMESLCKAEHEQCTQAKADCAQLERELHAAMHNQKALQLIVQELQATLATVKGQTQHSPSQSFTAHSVDAVSTSEHMHRQAQHRPSTTQYDTATEVSPSVVAALQQQVLELRAISAHLDQCQQQAGSQRLGTPHSTRQQSGQEAALLQYGHADRTSTVHGQQDTPLSHICKPLRAGPLRQPGPHQSSCISPASCSHVHETIRAHNGMQHSTDDKCWCGRPKRGTASVFSTPLRPGHPDDVHAAAMPKVPLAPLSVYSSKPARAHDRYALSISTRLWTSSCSQGLQ